MSNCDELYISFLFSHANDVSGITVLKRIIEVGHKVDVLHADISSSNDSIDMEFEKYIHNRILIDIDCNYDWFDCIFEFIEKGISSIKYDYKKIYSRSWLMSNHFLALEYKFITPDVFWKDEFSNQLIYDLSNNVKNYLEMIIDNEEYIKKINNQIDGYNIKNGTDFNFVENKSSTYKIRFYFYILDDRLLKSLINTLNSSDNLIVKKPLSYTALNVLYEERFRRKENFKNKANNLTKLNDEVLSSNSWKLTKSLRKIRKWC